MNRLTMVVAFALASSGCGKASEMDGFRDKMCGCKTKSGDRLIRGTCASEVRQAIKEWEANHPAEAKETGKAGEELAACEQEINKDAEKARVENGYPK